MHRKIGPLALISVRANVVGIMFQYEPILIAESNKFDYLILLIKDMIQLILCVFLFRWIGSCRIHCTECVGIDSSPVKLLEKAFIFYLMPPLNY